MSSGGRKKEVSSFAQSFEASTRPYSLTYGDERRTQIWRPQPPSVLQLAQRGQRRPIPLLTQPRPALSQHLPRRARYRPSRPVIHRHVRCDYRQQPRDESGPVSAASSEGVDEEGEGDGRAWRGSGGASRGRHSSHCLLKQLRSNQADEEGRQAMKRPLRLLPLALLLPMDIRSSHISP